MRIMVDDAEEHQDATGEVYTNQDNDPRPYENNRLCSTPQREVPRFDDHQHEGEANRQKSPQDCEFQESQHLLERDCVLDCFQEFVTFSGYEHEECCEESSEERKQIERSRVDRRNVELFTLRDGLNQQRSNDCHAKRLDDWGAREKGVSLPRYVDSYLHYYA